MSSPLCLLLRLLLPSCSTPAAARQAMDAMQQELSKLYADPVMTATPYRLHAVCVHQGDASLGHYWVYINADTSGLSSLLQSKCVCGCVWPFLCAHAPTYLSVYFDQCFIYVPRNTHYTIFYARHIATDNLSLREPLHLEQKCYC